jgi:hypothetical protein
VVENRRSLVHILEMTKRIHINVLLAVCTALVGFGILTIAISPGFFMNLLGAGMMGPGAPLPISSGPIGSNLNDPKCPGTAALTPGRAARHEARRRLIAI